MDFLNKIGDLANKAGKKTENLTKEAKIKMKMSENKSEIENLYKEIGKDVYQKHLKEQDFTREDFIENLLKIDNLSKEIENYQEEVRKLKNKRMCVKCNEEIDVNVKYCPNCGTEQPEIPQDEVLEGEIVQETESSENNTDTEA